MEVDRPVAPSLSLIRNEETTTVVLKSPILSRRVLGELAEALDELELEACPRPLVLASAHPTIFLAGAHLGEIAGLDQRSCIAYAELGRSIANRLASHSSAVVAAVHGSCSGGGFDLTMACDAVIASPGATFSHPGVRRGLVTGWGGSTSLDGVLGSPVLRRALLEGSELDAAVMKELGAVHSIASDPRAQARATARGLSLLHPSRLASWRLLRSSTFVDRFRAFVVEKS
jgi:enoyl-CoA hydratase/carnithine racemase